MDILYIIYKFLQGRDILCINRTLRKNTLNTPTMYSYLKWVKLQHSCVEYHFYASFRRAGLLKRQTFSLTSQMRLNTTGRSKEMPEIFREKVVAAYESSSLEKKLRINHFTTWNKSRSRGNLLPTSAGLNIQASSTVRADCKMLKKRNPTSDESVPNPAQAFIGEGNHD